MNFDEAFDRLLGHEGSYSNNPNDPGGETMWGVTARVARANGYTADMRSMPRDVAKAIYQALYWDACKAEQLPEAVRFDVFDGAVNSGVRQAAQWLQAALKVTADGVIGPQTLNAAQTSNGAALAARFNGLRLQFMTNLDNWPSFSRGWARRIAGNLMAQEG